MNFPGTPGHPSYHVEASNEIERTGHPPKPLVVDKLSGSRSSIKVVLLRV